MPFDIFAVVAFTSTNYALTDTLLLTDLLFIIECEATHLANPPHSNASALYVLMPVNEA